MGLLHPIAVLALKAAVSRAPSRLIQVELSGALVSTTMNIVLKHTSSSPLKGLAKILNHSFLDIISLRLVRVLQKFLIEIVCIQLTYSSV